MQLCSGNELLLVNYYNGHQAFQMLTDHPQSASTRGTDRAGQRSAHSGKAAAERRISGCAGWQPGLAHGSRARRILGQSNMLRCSERRKGSSSAVERNTTESHSFGPS